MSAALSTAAAHSEAAVGPAPRPWWALPPVLYPVKVGALVGLYYGSAKLGYSFGFAGPVAAIVWLPVGVAVSGLSLFGLALWPGVLAGDLLSNDYSALPTGAALAQTCGNMLEVLVAAWLIRRLLQRGKPLQSLPGVAHVAGALALGTAISAVVGPVSLALAGAVKTDSLFEVARTWWLGDLCGALVVVPLAIAWWPLPRRRPALDRHLVEGALLLVVVATLAGIAAHSHQPVAYLLFPALIWAAVRFGAQGATLAVAAAVSFTVWATSRHEGPFVVGSSSHSVVNTQIFVAVAAVSSLCLAALVAERELFAERLGESRAELYRAAETERRRIERALHDGAQQRLLALGLRLHVSGVRAVYPADSISFFNAESQLQAALDELRELSHGTHPSVLSELGLEGAIASVAARSTIPVTVLEVPDTPCGEVAEATVYYVVSEGVANAMKHSRAAAIEVRVTAASGTLRVEIADDGAGGASEQDGSGLRGLRERVEAAGGTFTLWSPAGRGTRLAATVSAGT
jgi:signal transduction histidine kinase